MLIIFIALLTDQVSQVLTTVGCDMRTDSSSGAKLEYGAVLTCL